MKEKKYLLIPAMLMCALLFGCTAGNEVSVVPETSTPQACPGGLPTPFEAKTMGDVPKDPYQRVHESVDYNAINPEEYRIRSAIEFVSIHNSHIGNVENPDSIQEINVNKYGIKNYCRYGELILFRTLEDMSTVFHNKSFKTYLNNKYGLSDLPNAYYVPKGLAGKKIERTFMPDTEKYYLLVYGYNYTDDGSFYTSIWAVYDVPDAPGANEISQFYANLNDLSLKSDETENGTVYHFTSKNGCAFFEKFGIETNDPATAYIWEQDGVIGVIILPGEYKAENLDLCVLEKHEL